MKSTLLTLIFVMIGFAFLQAQPQDNNFQKNYSQVQNVLAKNVETLNAGDVELIKNTIKLDPNYYGPSNQKLVSQMIQAAKSKKTEYDQFVKAQQDLHKTKQDLDETTDAKNQAINRGDSLFSENVQLKVLIEQLNNRINKLDKESKKLQSINKKIQQENLQTKDLLETSRTSIKRIMRLMPMAQKNELNDQIPSTLQDSLNQSECQIAELLKNNFVYTIDGFNRDKAFLDSASNYFRDNKIHLQIVDEYISLGNDLATRLKQSGTDCASNYAAEIEVAMSDFKTSIETSQMSFGEKFSKFMSDNLMIMIVLLVIIIALITMLFIRKKR